MTFEEEKKIAVAKNFGFGLGSVTGISVIVCFGMWGCPQWNVYSQKMEGEAQLAHAEYSKKIQVQDAVGKLEAAKHLADTDIERARGVAKSNEIIGASLKNNDGYLKWLYIEALKEKTGQEVIYVPTETGLPILEASHRK